MEIVRICGGNYTEYEMLILRRDSLKKQSLQIYDDYVRCFGEDIKKLYEIQVKCIRTKKLISYCQQEINYGKRPDTKIIIQKVENEMTEYYQQIQDMKRENELCKNAKEVPEKDVLKLKKIYHEIAKKIHPDVSPLTKEYPELLELWYQIVSAYNCNSLKEAEETQLLIEQFLSKKNVQNVEMVIPDINERIKNIKDEINQIMSTEPYIFQDILNDSSLVEAKKTQLREDHDNYYEYYKNLEKILKNIMEGYADEK